MVTVAIADASSICVVTRSLVAAEERKRRPTLTLICRAPRVKAAQIMFYPDNGSPKQNKKSTFMMDCSGSSRNLYYAKFVLLLYPVSYSNFFMM